MILAINTVSVSGELPMLSL